ncbi:thioredoxin TrxC [Rhodobacter sp. SGA-6-6]|uniref:thioredoxin TrxC n=1 Tax=Rhodobacter sp. SGA-6-6 TaxID=2710882 RepID=UPI0013ECEC9B|nr:thioredoxin TrxC [Rhodobacter sp. SGA-6-6]NGM45182.1 thioredoxin TrxC [Rhodobacter sp. SGA-6-6]
MTEATEAVRLTCATCGQGNRVPLARLGQGPKCGACGEPLTDARVAELDAATHDKVLRDGLPVLVDYWAPWCGPCRAMAPEFAKAAKTLAPGVRLMKLNTEDHPQISARAGIRGIPALILYRNGRELARLAGARPAAEIEGFVRQHLR